VLQCLMAPLDGSATAEMVLPYVTEIAVKSGARVILARVCEPDEQSGECRRYLETQAFKIRDGAGPEAAFTIKAELLTGEPFEAISRFAGEAGCDLIVMASHGVSNELRWPLGHTALKLLRASRIPIMLVRRHPERPPLLNGGLFRKILVPLDGSALGEAALKQAALLAPVTKSAVILLEVVEHVEVPPGSQTTGVRWQSANYENILTSLATRYLEEKAAGLRDKIKDITVKVVAGAPAGQIIEYAQANEVDLIIMSSHGRSGIGRWYFGSVAEKVLNAGDFPLLVVRPGHPEG
jgi:nucleotide-binding universal stress UspA family protein